MEWVISGTLKGKQGQWKIKAADEDSAEAKAKANGVTVHTLRPYRPVPSPIAETSATAVEEPAIPTTTVSTCANCLRAIGRLETPWEYQGEVVCAECAARLTPQTPQVAPVYVPSYAAVNSPTAQHVQTIEKTSKKWKLQMLVAALMSMVGLVVMVFGWGQVSHNGNPPPAAVGAILLIGGLAWFTAVQFMAWWHHG